MHTPSANRTAPTATPTAAPTARSVRGALGSRSVRAALTVLALALGALLLADGTASAKSGVAVSVSTHALRLGQSVRVTGTGGDDAARLTYLCIDSKGGGSGTWLTVTCNWQPFSPVSASVRGTRRGTAQFRARLLARHYPGGPLYTDRVSATTTVLVH